jgi:hypothetical protein
MKPAREERKGVTRPDERLIVSSAASKTGNVRSVLYRRHSIAIQRSVGPLLSRDLGEHPEHPQVDDQAGP